MGASYHIKTEKRSDYSVGAKERMFSLVCLGVGAVLTIIGLFLAMDNPARIFSSLLYNNYFFLMLGLVSAFFVASQTMGYNGWYVMVKRISEAMALYVPVGGVLMAVILFFGFSDIYIWSHKEYFDPNSPLFDSILKNKEPYLNATFFFIRMIIYVGVWALLVFWMRRNSLNIDKDGSGSISSYNTSKYISALFIVFFAVTSSTSAWDWLMSIQPHWYSTLFGWYCFISMFVTTMAVTIIVCTYLKSQGYLPYMNDEHFHDLGKLMFAFSVAWAYLFFSQFMLIWYSNIPEETMYYKIRIEHYSVLMWSCVVLNFVTPFLVLMTRGAKRNRKVLVIGACIIFFGHWLDFYQMAVPGAVMEAAHHAHAVGGDHHATIEAGNSLIHTVAGGGDHGHGADGHGDGHHVADHVSIGLFEIGLLITYIGLFSFIMFQSLAKAPIEQVNHPFFKESVIHHT